MADERVEIEILARDFATKVFQKVGTTAQTEGKKTVAAVGTMDKAAKRLQGTMIRTAATFIGLGVAIASIRKGAADFIAFNRAIAEVSTILDETTIPLAEVEKRVKALSIAMGENEALVARGFYQTLSAGVTEASDAFLVLEASATLAVAGVARTEETVDAITTVLNAYGFSADRAAEVSDKLFKTVELGKTRVSELAASLGQVVPIAAELGLAFEEVLAGTVAITKQGASTAEAITRIRAVMVALLKNSEDVDKALRRVGGSFDLTTIRTQGLLPTLLQLREAFAGNEDALTKFLGRVEATTGTLALTRAGGQDFIEVLDGITNSAGAAGIASDKQLSKVAKQLDIIRTGLRQGFAGLAGEGFLLPIVKAAEEFGGVEDAAIALRGTIESLAPVLRVPLALVGLFAQGLLTTVGAALALKDVISDVDDDVFRDLAEAQVALAETTKFLATGQADFTATRIIQSRKVAELLAKEQAAVASLSKEIVKQITISDEGIRIDPFVDFEGLQEDIAELESRSQAAGESVVQHLAVALKGTETSVAELAVALRALGIEFDFAGHAATQIEALRIQIQAIADAPPAEPIGDQSDRFADVRDQLTRIVEDARAAGHEIDTALVREIAIPLEVDPDELIRTLDLATGEALAALEVFAERANKIVSQLDLSPDATARDAGIARSLLGPLEREFEEITTAAAEAGVEIPRALLDPLLFRLVGSSEERVQFRIFLAKLVADARAAGEDATGAVKIDATGIAAISALLEDAQREAKVLAAEVAAGVRPELDLIKLGAEIARLEFQKLGAESALDAGQLARAIQAINIALRRTVSAAGEADAGIQTFLTSFLDLFGRAAGAVRDTGVELFKIAQSEQRIGEISEETLAPFEAQRKAILAQAEAWSLAAEKSLAATNLEQLAREFEAIDRTTQALLDRLDAEEQLAGVQANAQIASIQARAGILSRADAAEAATEAEIEHFRALASTAGLLQGEIDATIAGLRRQAQAEEELRDIQIERRTIALQQEGGSLGGFEARAASLRLEIDLIDAEREALILTEDQWRRQREAAEDALDAVTSFSGRFASNLQQLEDSVSGPGIADRFFGGLTSAIDNASRALVDSEASFADFRDAVVQDFLEIIANIAITEAALFALKAVGIEAPERGGGVDTEEAAKAAAILSVPALLLDKAGREIQTGALAMTATLPAALILLIAGKSIETGAVALGASATTLLTAALLLAASGASTLAEGGVVPGQLKGFGPIEGFAQGGVKEGQPRGSFDLGSLGLPERRYAFGGIADSPQLAVFGEGSGAEAFVPLGADRKIPVKIETDGQPQTGGGEFVQNIDARFQIDVTGLDPAGTANAVSVIMPQVMEQFSQTIRGGGRGSRDAIESIRFAARERG